MMEINRVYEHRFMVFVLIVCVLYQNFSFCFSLNDEGYSLLRFRESVLNDPYGALSNWNDGVGVIDPCLWFGVECSGGKVVALNLGNLCLGGTISPDLGNLVHMQSIILRNNSFSGTIPDKIGKLKELEVLDLGYNNFSGPLPSDLGNNLSLTILLLDNNELFGSISPEVLELKFSSEVQVDESQLSKPGLRYCCNRRNTPLAGDFARRKLLQFPDPSGGPNLEVPSPPSPSSSPPTSPSPSSETPSSSPAPSPGPDQTRVDSPPSLHAPPPSLIEAKTSNHRRVLVLSAGIVGSAALVILVFGIIFWRCSKAATVKPWATGLSGQLQKAFVTGVPQLKRSELEAACEDFSNVIGSSSIGTIYKGTLSSGVEIAVASVAAKSAYEWSKSLETQFRKKIDTLSKVNHKNFVNLLGFCVEEEPFTRMIVFEYAPNGTLFEHLHAREAEHLDWVMRMRIAMGMAYCLEHMHQLTPPIAHKNLDSSSVSLTEDYAAKISDFCLRNDSIAAKTELNQESNIYSFGVILFEMITGRFPSTKDSDSLDDWASDYLKGEQTLNQIVDPTLRYIDAEQLEQIGDVIKTCVHPDPRRRARMRDVTARLRDITGIGPEAATPKISPLWWAELEILSTEAA